MRQKILPLFWPNSFEILRGQNEKKIMWGPLTQVRGNLLSAPLRISNGIALSNKFWSPIWILGKIPPPKEEAFSSLIMIDQSISIRWSAPIWNFNLINFNHANGFFYKHVQYNSEPYNTLIILRVPGGVQHVVWTRLQSFLSLMTFLKLFQVRLVKPAVSRTLRYPAFSM